MAKKYEKSCEQGKLVHLFFNKLGFLSWLVKGAIMCSGFLANSMSLPMPYPLSYWDQIFWLTLTHLDTQWDICKQVRVPSMKKAWGMPGTDIYLIFLPIKQILDRIRWDATYIFLKKSGSYIYMYISIAVWNKLSQS